jgi:hypothetical protein
MYNYDFNSGRPTGKWVLSNNNKTVTQTVNADPSMYLNNISQTSYAMDGSWQVIPSSYNDDDFIGFVFGYQDSSHFYIMDWKQSDQDQAGYGVAQEGFTIKRISADSVVDLTLSDFWSSTGSASSTILASEFGDTLGWSENTAYGFHLGFEPGKFSITVSLGATALWDVTVNDSTYTYGQFGFYNHSQEQVQYSGFEQTPYPPPIPEPSTLFLLGSGVAGLALYGRNRRMNRRS